MASSKPLNPNANPYLSNSTVLLGQQSQCSTASTLLLTHQTPSFSLLAYYWPKYYYSCYSPNLNVQAHTPLLYQPKVVSHSSLPLSSEPPKCLKVPSPSSELVSHGGDGERRACEARRRKIGVPKKNRRESPEVSPEKTSEKEGSGESTVDNNIGCGVIGFSEFSDKTTLMLKNIPNHFRRRDLIRVMNQHCRTENSKKISVEQSIKSEYDFLYLPMDFNKYWHERKTSNLGYAFVNFTSAIAAWRFYNRFNKYDWQALVNNKICEVTLAKIQGREALEENFRTKMFFCHSDEYLPLVLNPACDGTSSYRRGRNIGIRVPTAPRRRMVKYSSTPAKPEAAV